RHSGKDGALIKKAVIIQLRYIEEEIEGSCMVFKKVLAEIGFTTNIPFLCFTKSFLQVIEMQRLLVINLAFILLRILDINFSIISSEDLTHILCLDAAVGKCRVVSRAIEMRAVIAKGKRGSYLGL